MRKYITLLICTYFVVHLSAQESVRFDSVRIYEGFLGYDGNTSECQSQVLGKDFEVFKMNKGILNEYFKRRSIGDIRGASRLLNRNAELRKFKSKADNFTFVATVYVKYYEQELGLNCKLRIEGYLKHDSVLFARDYWAPSMIYFFSSNESFKNLETNNPFIKEQIAKDSLKVYSNSGFKSVIIPEGVYDIEAKFIGYLIPYYFKAFELIAIKPAD